MALKADEDVGERDRVARATRQSKGFGGQALAAFVLV
jgi:hypothetical protein